ncbi:ABC transporter substrate-binding protein [Paenibacillus sp. IB182496]|uniref:ABC transporter substrate-binding protein n=1 Tax=Paenibacillus sabuli TaxID=2772509 RepID=A0A927BR82_9BACL|nr:ABC transporter substrate-binding protein [Paenibacillus sabuli]MBD2844280.1 ABC transporter substrate-binding protein [Paenibacillus sabuli]
MSNELKQRARKGGWAALCLVLCVLLLAACGGQDESTNANTESATGANNEAGASEQGEGADRDSAAGENGANGANGAGDETDAAQGPRTVTDGMGHEVVIPAEPQAIIAPYLEDHLLTLGIEPVAQWSVSGGTSVLDYLQDRLGDVPTIDYALPPEAVTSFGPDLIIVSSETLVQNGLYEQYTKIAPTYVLGDAVTGDWREALRVLGAVLDREQQAADALAAYEAKAEEARQQLEQELAGETVEMLWLAGKQFYLVDQTQASGAVVYGDLGLQPSSLSANVPNESSAVWRPVSLELLGELDADHIFLVNSDKDGFEQTTESALWQSLPAVKAGQVYEMPSTSSWLYTGAIANARTIDDVLAALGEQ